LKDGEELVQSGRWKKLFGGFSRKRFNGFIVNIWLNFANGQLEDKKNKGKTTIRLQTTLHELH
jgi:hypothetical protein